MDPKNSTIIDFKIKNNTTEKKIVVGQRAWFSPIYAELPF